MFTTQKINALLKASKCLKVARQRMLYFKNISNYILNHLIYVMERCVEEGEYSNEFKKTIVKLLLKIG